MKKVKIKIIRTLPISPKHGAVEGAEFEADIEDDGSAWFDSPATGEQCRAFCHEFDFVEEDES